LPRSWPKAAQRKPRSLKPDTAAAKLWLTNRKPHEWKETQKHEIQVERKSSAELLDELHNKLIELKLDGYLSDLPLKQLPAPENTR
jgi:hypothetical protein